MWASSLKCAETRDRSWTCVGRCMVTLFLVVPGLISAPGAARAQEPCETSLHFAAQLFEDGRLHAARGHVEECLQAKPRRQEKARAYTLLAKIHLADDNLPAAGSALRRLLAIDPEFEPALGESPRFVRLVEEVRSRSRRPTVTSVSKAKESLLEAPATVAVITAEEIERRGYLDLAAVLRDLPGFDFSRFYGAPFSNIYQRGYRSNDTTRTLLLIDGVEDNDLHSSVAYIGRQFPLSNIDRIEVVYGPASTMYGANAFAGVINVITKDATQIVPEKKRFGYDAWLTAGSWNTGSLDATVAGTTATGSLGWSLAARRYTSDELDLSGYPDWDYDPSFYDSVGYQTYASLNSTTPEDVQNILRDYSPALVSRYFTIVTDDEGVPVALHLNDQGVLLAAELDKAAFDDLVNGRPLEFSNPTEDWLVYGKLETSNLVAGLQLYSRGEGSNPPVTDRWTGGAKNGSVFTVEHLFLYLKYIRRFLDDRLTMTFFNRYKIHELDGSKTGFAVLRSYEQGRLGITDLLDANEASWSQNFVYRSNNQLRSELSLFYDHSERFNVIGGVELRFSSIGAKNISSSTPPASETGFPFDIEGYDDEGNLIVSGAIPGGNEIASRDLGAYAQASYRVLEPLRLVAGVRFDNNRIRDTGGYGTVFNPRLAAIYSWRDWVFKGVYAEAFQDAPMFFKYETSEARQLANPNLAPEEVQNLELSAAWSPRQDLVVQMSAYRAQYEGIVEEVEVECPPDVCEGTTRQFQNRGRLDLKGIQAEARWTPEPYRLLGNYTFSDPYNPDLDARVGDIADHRINLVGELTVRDRLDLSLRVNAVFGRETGAGTTVSSNPFRKIDDYVIADMAVTYRSIIKGLDLQLAINNIFDTEYFDPGYRSANDALYAARIPQPERSFFLSIRAHR